MPIDSRVVSAGGLPSGLTVASGVLTFGALQIAETGVVSPATIAGAINDYNGSSGALITGSAQIARISCTALARLTGMQGGIPGRRLRLCNVSTNFTNVLVLMHNSSSSSAANRFFCSTATAEGSAVVHAQTYVDLWYDGTSTRWRVGAPYPMGTSPGLTFGVAALIDIVTATQYMPPGFFGTTLLTAPDVGLSQPFTANSISMRQGVGSGSGSLIVTAMKNGSAISLATTLGLTETAGSSGVSTEVVWNTNDRYSMRVTLSGQVLTSPTNIMVNVGHA